ncbi:MAG: sugar transporter [Paucimonas sp.]|jgi:polysaccharide export outer membrane protein|nr:sugar transporter [Paucimonas sp.]
MYSGKKYDSVALLHRVARQIGICILGMVLIACSTSGVQMRLQKGGKVAITDRNEERLPQGGFPYKIGIGDLLQVDVYALRISEKQRKVDYSNELRLEFYFDGDSYRISRGDELGIELSGESDKMYEVAVLPSGVINLPRIGRPVTAIGHTPTELAAKLNKEYTVLLRRPEVIVSVKRSGLDQLQRLSGNYIVDHEGQIVVPLLGSSKVVGSTSEEVAKNMAVKAKDYFQNRVEVVASILPVTSGAPDVRRALDGQQYFHNAVKVAPDGSIFIPDVGPLAASGKTLDELNREIQSLFGRFYQNDVQVRVSLQDSPSQNVFIGGEVRSPGKYPHNASLTLMQLISSAGWVTDNADLSQVTLLHAAEGNKYIVYRTNLLEVVNGKARLKQDLKLSPRDIVVVPKSDIAKVDQWVDQYIRRVLPFGTSVNYTFTNQHNDAAATPQAPNQVQTGN